MATEMEIAAIASYVGIDAAVFRGYSNLEQGKLPQSIQSLEDFGNSSSNNPYQIRRRWPDGSWHPIVPGPTPGKDPNDPGFHHVIANCEDTCNGFPFPDPVGLGAAILAGDSRWIAAWNDRVHGFPYGGFKTPAPVGGLTPGDAGTAAKADGGKAAAGSGGIDIPGVGHVSTPVAMAAAVGLGLVALSAARRR